MFLVGGPAFSGKTLLAHLLNQDGVVCLDEPDFHDPKQNHRGIPILAELFPGKIFPPKPDRKLSYHQAVKLIAQCQEIIRPANLGVKTANWVFVEYAKLYKQLGYPVVAIVRDIRDAYLEAPLPPWVSEKSLNARYRLVWKHRRLYDQLVRYEDLVTKPTVAMAQISQTLGQELKVKSEWAPESVHATMFKLERHTLLRLGIITGARVGIWKDSAATFSNATRKTAVMMGYGD